MSRAHAGSPKSPPPARSEPGPLEDLLSVVLGLLVIISPLVILLLMDLTSTTDPASGQSALLIQGIAFVVLTVGLAALLLNRQLDQIRRRL